MKTKETLILWVYCMAVFAGTLVALAAPPARVQETEKPAAETQEKTAQQVPQHLQIARNVQANNLVWRVDPKYPKEAKKKHLQGNVRIGIVVDLEGRVIKTEVLSGHPILAKAAVQAVRQWRYKPTLLNGRPVLVESEVELHFHHHKWRVD